MTDEEKAETIRDLELEKFDLQVLEKRTIQQDQRLTVLGRYLQALRVEKQRIPGLVRTQVKK